ncbi:MAG: cell wall hydrolase [Eubacteriaceae bacterium]
MQPQKSPIAPEQTKKPAKTIEQPRNEEQVSRGTVNRSDYVLMAQVIEGEAAGEPFVGKVAVGAVIINRLESDEFPNDVRKIIYQTNAFEAVTNGQYKRTTSNDSFKAAEMAINGSDPTNGCVYYWNPKTATSKWVWQRPIMMQIGQHVFAK